MSKWVPNDGEDYFYIDSDGIVSEDVWAGTPGEHRKLNFCNVFRLKSDAIYAIEQVKTLLGQIQEEQDTQK